jgi:tetratricopeptide (TPR) repeat protein
MTAPRDREPRGANDTGRPSLELDAAVAATRRAFDGETGLSSATERRILEATRRRRRFRPVTWLVPLAAAFVASAAVAHGFGAFGALRARWFGETRPAASVAASASGALAPRAAAPVVSAPPLVPPVPKETSPTAPEPSVLETARATQTQEPEPRLAPPPIEPPSPPASAPAEAPKVDEMALYREAHRAHFSERNYALALAHWDRYLALSPRGAFVLEARYNRGVALYRLGRREAAAEALRPFADGVYGGYRSDEATRMLQELR